MTERTRAVRLPRLEKTLERVVADCAEEADLLKRILRTTAVLDLFEEYALVMARLRSDAVREMQEGGWTYRALAAELGISKTRTHQIARRPD